MGNFKSNNNVFYDCKFHVIWCVKYRRKIITPEIEARLKEIIMQVSVERNADIIEMEGNADHFHLLVSVDPQYGIHRLVKQIKGRSSRLLRKEFQELKRRLPTLWTNSYCCITVGGAPVLALKQYIESQKDK